MGPRCYRPAEKQRGKVAHDTDVVDRARVRSPVPEDEETPNNENEIPAVLSSAR